MTVAELIEELKKAPPDAPVHVYSCDAPYSDAPMLAHAVLVKTSGGERFVALCEEGAHHFEGAYVVA